jgi:putative ABC transport system substrate-binding protein
MRRRQFLSAITGYVVAAPLGLKAQQVGRVYRLGILRSTSPSAEIDVQIPLALRALGYVEGRNLLVEYRHARGKAEALPILALELVQHRLDLICTVGLAATRAAKEATSSIPIVMFGAGDPVAEGLVSSLARPGGNVTGVLLAAGGTLTAKRLELLKELVPQAARIALLVPHDPSAQGQVQQAQIAAPSLGSELVVVEVHDDDYEGAFATIRAKSCDALIVASSTYFVRDRLKIIDRAATHRLPAIYESPEHAQSGGLMAYGTSTSALERRRALYIDRIFKGAKPGDLPIEQPTTFKLVINLRTAKALGIAVPQSLKLRADEVME